jgi:hypothetical protein
MSDGGLRSDVDFIEELRLRRWARENYVAVEFRDDAWHPVVLDEMTRKDDEVGEPELALASSGRA